MKELLSNEEIDTLMEMFRSEESELEDVSDFAQLEAGPALHESVVAPIDLLEPHRVSREQMREFERLFEGAARTVGTSMCEKLRYEMHCDCVAVEQTRFANWMQLVGTQAVVYVLDASPLAIPILFSVTRQLLYGSVDRMLGGHGRVEQVPQEFTAAEYVVADAFLEPIFAKLAASMEPLTRMDLRIEDRFTNPALANLLPSQDVVLAAHFQTGGDFLLGDLRVAMPYAAIEPFLPRLGNAPRRFEQRRGTLRRQLAESVQSVRTSLSVELGGAALSLRRLLALSPGDVVLLDRRRGDALVAPVAGIPKFAGRVGTVGNRLGYRVETVLE